MPKKSEEAEVSIEKALKLMESIELNICTDGYYEAYARIPATYDPVEGRGATVEEAIDHLITVYWDEIEKDA